MPAPTTTRSLLTGGLITLTTLLSAGARRRTSKRSTASALARPDKGPCAACTFALQRGVGHDESDSVPCAGLGLSVREEAPHEGYGDTSCHRSLLRSHGPR